jgi:hypothetical protein
MDFDFAAYLEDVFGSFLSSWSDFHGAGVDLYNEIFSFAFGVVDDFFGFILDLVGSAPI